MSYLINLLLIKLKGEKHKVCLSGCIFVKNTVVLVFDNGEKLRTSQICMTTIYFENSYFSYSK